MKRISVVSSLAVVSMALSALTSQAQLDPVVNARLPPEDCL